MENQKREEILKKYPLSALYINPTFRCNLRCKHCWVGTEDCDSPIEAPLDFFKSVIEQAIPLGLKKIKFTGGEPFFSSSTLGLLRFIKDKGLQIIFETNATLITREVAERLKETRLYHIAVSLDSGVAEFHDQKRGLKGAFQKAVEGIRNLNAVGLRPQIIMSLFKGDFDRHFSSLLDLGKTLQILNVKINPIVDVGRAEELRDKYTLGEVLAIYHKILGSNLDTQIIFDLPHSLKTLRDIREKRSRCGILGIMGVLPDRKISICGIGLSFPELSYRVKCNGQVDGECLEKLWLDASIFQELREVLPNKLEGVCAKCIWSRICLGKCRAFAYAKYNDFRAPHPICQQAYDEGLFPRFALKENYAK